MWAWAWAWAYRFVWGRKETSSEKNAANNCEGAEGNKIRRAQLELQCENEFAFAFVVFWLLFICVPILFRSTRANSFAPVRCPLSALLFYCYCTFSERGQIGALLLAHSLPLKCTKRAVQTVGSQVRLTRPSTVRAGRFCSFIKLSIGPHETARTGPL